MLLLSAGPPCLHGRLSSNVRPQRSHSALLQRSEQPAAPAPFIDRGLDDRFVRKTTCAGVNRFAGTHRCKWRNAVEITLTNPPPAEGCHLVQPRSGRGGVVQVVLCNEPWVQRRGVFGGASLEALRREHGYTRKNVRQSVCRTRRQRKTAAPPSRVLGGGRSPGRTCSECWAVCGGRPSNTVATQRALGGEVTVEA